MKRLHETYIFSLVIHKERKSNKVLGKKKFLLLKKNVTRFNLRGNEKKERYTLHCLKIKSSLWEINHPSAPRVESLVEVNIIFLKTQSPMGNRYEF